MRFLLLIAYANAAQYCYWTNKMKDCEGDVLPKSPCLDDTDTEQLGVD